MKEEQGAALDKSQSIFPGVTNPSLWLAVCGTAGVTNLAGAASERGGEGEQGGHGYFLAGGDGELSGTPVSTPPSTELTREEDEARKRKSW